MSIEREQRPRKVMSTGLEPALDQRVARAIQPVMANLRQQLAGVLTQQIEQSGLLNEPDLIVETRPRQAPKSATRQVDNPEPQNGQTAGPTQAPADTERPRAPSSGQASPRGAARDATEPVAPHPSPGPDDRRTDDRNESVSALLSDVLRSSSRILGRTLIEHGNEWLRAALNAVLDALFSEEMQATVGRQIEERLDALVRETFDTFPVSESKAEAERRTQTELDATLQETLDAIFSGPLRTDLQRYGDQAINAVLCGDFQTARWDGEKAAETFFDDVARSLQDHWVRVLRLLLGATVSLLQQEAQCTMRERTQDGAQELEERLEEGPKEGARESTRNSKTGRPPPPAAPSSRGTPGRAPLGRPPSGRPPLGRPPSTR